MTVRKIKFLLWSGSASLVVGAVWVAVEASHARRDAGIVQVPKAAAIDASETPSSDLPSLAELQSLSQRDLRRALYDPPPPTPGPPQPVVLPPPPFTLAGTVIEPGHCRAMLMLADGKLQFKKIGDEADGAQVTDITRDSVTVKYQGRNVVLKVEKKG